jgi:hypothetical protein
MVDGARIVVPDSLDLITCYVLREQQDWFEDEIKFLRKLLWPGQQVIDIGADLGVYALSMARTVGPTGPVWTFELLAEQSPPARFNRRLGHGSRWKNLSGSARSPRSTLVNQHFPAWTRFAAWATRAKRCGAARC